MTDYTDIRSRIEDIQRQLNALSDLIVHEYDNAFPVDSGYTTMASATVCCVKHANEALSDAYELNSELEKAMEEQTRARTQQR